MSLVFLELCAAMRQGRIYVHGRNQLMPARRSSLPRGISGPLYNFGVAFSDEGSLLSRDVIMEMPSYSMAVSWLANACAACVIIYNPDHDSFHGDSISHFYYQDGKWVRGSIISPYGNETVAGRWRQMLWLIGGTDRFRFEPDLEASRLLNSLQYDPGIHEAPSAQVIDLHLRSLTAERGRLPRYEISSSSKSPHDRRSHARFYKKSGKVIEVRASKIHGGGDTNYVVTP